MTILDINKWFESSEYLEKVDALFSNIARKSELAQNESETSSVFERELYFFLRSELGIEFDISKEQHIDHLTHTFKGLAGRKSGHGRLDAVINNLIIEYKHHSKLNNETDTLQAIHQVEDYLNAKKLIEGTEYDAILTDGLHISYFSFVENAVSHTPLRKFSAADVDKIIQAILHHHTKKFTPKNIVCDFSLSGQTDSLTRHIALTLFKGLTEQITGKSKMLYAEWKSLIHLSIDDNGKSADIEKRRRDLSEIFRLHIDDAEAEYKALYALHTTYAVIVKLIACHVLGESAGEGSLSNLPCDKMQQFFERMEEGLSYRNMRVRNLLEGDFFSWYADKEQWSEEFWNEAQELLSVIEEYSAFSLGVKYAPVDIFKDLYMGIIPQSVRHSMGEYFTPEWLADSVICGTLDRIKADDWRAIDPCCGSGIFLIALIRKVVGDTAIGELTNAERQTLVSEITNRVKGVDINPLSVLSARVSYYLALSQIGKVKDVEIPVFLGDSALVPSLEIIDSIDCYTYTIHNLRNEVIRVVLPKRLVESDGFTYLMDDIQSMVNADSEDSIMTILTGKLTDKERQSMMLLSYLQTMVHSLVHLHQNNWDGIWVRIITNFMMVAQMRRADMIVGNPPWVKWEHLPAAYTRRIKEFCDVRHIFCNDGGMYGGAQLNICALISNVVAANWLTEEGVLAFLMPDSIMSQNSYEEFRNFYVNYEKHERMYLNRIDRWMSPLRPFKVGNKSVAQDFNTYYYSRQVTDYAQGVPVNTISKHRGISDEAINQCRTWNEAQNHLTIEEGLAKQLSATSTAFTYISSQFDFSSIIGPTAYHYRTGVESTPFEIFKMLGVGPSEHGSTHYRFRNKQLKTSRYKVEDIPDDGWDFDTRYIYPIVEGPNVKPFEYDTGNNYHIIPYEEDNTLKPVPMSTLYELSPSLAVYFANHKSLLDQQSEKSKTMHRGNEFFALSKIGPYTFAPHMVAARDNSTFCASVIHPTLTPWGEMKQSICVKHTIIISQDTDGHFISEDEAHYINGVLNSSIVKAYIHNTFKTNGFSLKKSHLYLPKYNAENPIQVKIAKLSKKATAHAAKREQIMNSLTEEYLKLCKCKK
jgi:hypothetical protein